MYWEPKLERVLCVIAALKVLEVRVLGSWTQSHEDVWTCPDHTFSWPRP